MKKATQVVACVKQKTLSKITFFDMVSILLKDLKKLINFSMLN
ncbi:hypothetical protein [Mycoplasma leachii]